MRNVRTRSLAAAIIGLLFFLPAALSAQGKTPLTNFFKAGEVSETIVQWEKAKNVYYGTLYEQGSVVAVEKGASSLLVGRYATAALPGDVVKLGEARIVALARTEIEDLLNKAFVGEITSKFKTVTLFHEAILQRKSPKVEIDQKRMETVLAQEDCGIIPCDPKKCNPDTCARRSMERSFPNERKR